MSHVKRVKKAGNGALRVLICSRWEYDTCMTGELKAEIEDLAGRAIEKGNDGEAVDSKPLLESVILPDRLVYIREIYNRLRETA